MQYSLGTAIDRPASVDPFANFMENSITPIQDQWLIPTGQEALTDRPGSPADEEITGAYEKMALPCVGPGR